MMGRLAAILGAAITCGACQSMAQPAPAVLASSDAATMDRLKAALARATGQARIELGPSDPTHSPVISVLPRPAGPQVDRNPARPTIFRLEMEGGACFLVREESGARIALEGVACRAAGD